MNKDLIKGILLMVICTVFTSLAVIFNKKGAMMFSWTLEGTIFNWGIIIGLFLLGVGFILLSLALKYGEVSILYPIVSISYIWAFILSILIYVEKFSFNKLLGIVIIIVGLIVLLKSDQKKKRGNKK